MDDRAENQNLGATTKFSALDWPTPEMLQAANRARAKAFRDHSISKLSRDAANTDVLRVAPKR